MRLVNFTTGASPGGYRLGALDGETIHDLSSSHADTDAWLRAGANTVSLDSEPVHSLSEVRLGPAVLRPGKIMCLGRNYAAHAAELGNSLPDYPMIFLKPASSLAGHGDTIEIPAETERPDYEAELAVVIGSTCRDIEPEQSLSQIAAYTVANDVSARDLQRRTAQFAQGKMSDTFCPLGPALVTPEEISDPASLRLRAILNGTTMQDDTTANMIFDVAFTISYLSKIATLEAGDVILTGTPEGVGAGRTPPVWLSDGDEITIDIDEVGTLTNRVRRPAQDSTD